MFFCLYFNILVSVCYPFFLNALVCYSNLAELDIMVTAIFCNTLVSVTQTSLFLLMLDVVSISSYKLLVSTCLCLTSSLLLKHNYLFLGWSLCGVSLFEGLIKPMGSCFPYLMFRTVSFICWSVT